MQNSLTDISSDCIQTVMDGLRKNNMDVQYVPHKEEAAAAVASLLKEGDTIAVGGSVTLEETGVLELVQNGRYHFIDRYEDGLSDRERKDCLTEAFRSDVFLCSANAITKNGEIYQVDGLSNRIAPLVFGPDSVIIVAGINKIAADIEAAVYRVKTVTVPAIVKRRGLDAPCARLGSCIAADQKNMASGCMCDARRCCNYLVLGRQRVKGRIKVILVGETLGF